MRMSEGEIERECVLVHMCEVLKKSVIHQECNTSHIATAHHNLWCMEFCLVLERLFGIIVIKTLFPPHCPQAEECVVSFYRSSLHDNVSFHDSTSRDRE